MTLERLPSDTFPHHTRLLARGDEMAVIEHLLALPEYDRYLRFCGSLSDPVIARLVKHRIDNRDHVFIGYSIGPLLVGVAQLARPDATTTNWEIAVSVDPAYRRLGVASRLMREAIAFARENSIHALTISMLPENKPMISLAKRFNFVLRKTSQSIVGRLTVGNQSAVSPSNPTFAVLPQ